MQELEASKRLFFDSGRDTPIKLAMSAGTAKVPFSENLIAWLSEGSPTITSMSWFSIHSSRAMALPKNDNAAIDQVVKRLAQIAVECDAAIEVPHHGLTRLSTRADRQALTIADPPQASSPTFL
jgi:hypothetical protein